MRQPGLTQNQLRTIVKRLRSLQSFAVDQRSSRSAAVENQQAIITAAKFTMYATDSRIGDAGVAVTAATNRERLAAKTMESFARSRALRSLQSSSLVHHVSLLW